MDSKNIVGISGRAHNGKTMLSEYLMAKGYVKMSVADALKRICASVLGFGSIENMNAVKTEHKEYVLGDLDIKYLSEESGVPHEFVKGELAKINNTITSVRHALQYIGTDIFRKYDKDWHVKQLEKNIYISKNPNIVIDDIRFDNEFKLMRELNALKVRIVRPVIDNITHHKSEEELTWQMFKNVIINDSTPEHAISQLEAIMRGDKNKIFDTVLSGYIKLDLDDKCVLTDDNYNIKIIDKKVNRVIDVFNIKDNVLIIEDLKPHLTYAKKDN